MNKKVILGVAALTGLLAASSLTYARGPSCDGDAMGMRMGVMRMEQMKQMLDTNKDGTITKEEMDAKRTAALNEFDADKNGALSLAEFQNYWLKRHNEMMVRAFQKLDSDGSGAIVVEEFQAPGDRMMEHMDMNQDGNLTTDELQMRHGKHGMRHHGKQGGYGYGNPGAMNKHAEMGMGCMGNMPGMWGMSGMSGMGGMSGNVPPPPFMMNQNNQAPVTPAQ